ncbi:MAG: alpha/beta hydrolase [Nonlabens sp.]
MKVLPFIFTFCFIFSSFAQDPFSITATQKPFDSTAEFNVNSDIKGTLKVAAPDKKTPLLIFVPDQGVVDRNGNDMRSRHNAYQQLADSLFNRGISSYRYDKRTFTQVKNRRVDDNTSFDDFVKDLKEVIYKLSNDQRFSRLVLLGHGQGSLVAMLAMDSNVDRLISISGSAMPIDDVIVEQIKLQQPGLDKVARKTFDKVKSQDAVVTDVEKDLISILHPSIQPFMKSWMKYDPQEVAKKIQIPVLVVHGDKDRQVDLKQARLLNESFPNSELFIIRGVNHIFKTVGEDEVVASKSYIDPNYQLSREMVEKISSFVTDN